MKKFYLTYSSNKNLQRVSSVIAEYTNPRNFSKIDLTYINKFCGSLAYACLFIMPEHKLFDGAKYTIPEVCLEHKGLFSHELYEYANRLGELSIVTDEKYAIKLFEEIMDSCFLIDSIQCTQMKPVDTYIALAACYAYLRSDSELMELCVETNFNKVWRYVTKKYLGGMIQ